MLKPEALFMYGMYESVLEDIWQIQSELPEQIMFLQPYSPYRIVKLQSDPPTVESSMLLFLSTKPDIAIVRYEAEIVGWDDKRTLSQAKRDMLNRLIAALQPRNSGLYKALSKKGRETVNLLYVRRLKRLTKPYSLEQLRKTSDGKPLSSGKCKAGGWAYVKVPSV